MAKANGNCPNIRCHHCGKVCEVAHTFTFRSDSPTVAPLDLCEKCFVEFAEAFKARAMLEKTSHGTFDESVYVADYRKSCPYHDKYREKTRAEKQAEWLKAHPPEDSWGASQQAIKAAREQAADAAPKKVASKK